MQLSVTGRKRTSSCAEHEQQQQENCRAAGRPFCKGEGEAQAWLERHGMHVLLQRMGPLPAAFWLALAELNIALAAFQHTFQDLRLLEHHSFSRCPVQVAFETLAFARGCRDAGSLSHQPHLAAVAEVLRTGLAGCCDAVISTVTLLCPPFLSAWAARWLPAGACGSGGSPPRVRLTVVQGYRAHSGPLRATTVYNLGLPAICSTPAATTVYIPCAQ